MTTLTAVQRQFPFVQPRMLNAGAAIKDKRVFSFGEKKIMGFNWSIVVNQYDSTIASSTWETGATHLTLTSSSITDITSQVTIEAVGKGNAVLKNTVTLANGLKFVQFLELDVVDLDGSSSGVVLNAAGLASGAVIQVDGVAVSDEAPTLDFDGTDFTLTESPTDDFDITLNAERIQDIAGAMFTGNTETGITVTYQDIDGTIDVTVSDLTVAADTGSTGMTPGDTLTVTGGTGITTAMSGDTLTITNSSTDTNTTIQVDGVAQSTNAPTLDFDGTDFTLTESPTDDFDVTIQDSGIDHDATTNFVANEHIDHTSVTLTAGTGLSGGGDISTNRTFNLDVDGLTADTAVGATDTIPIYDGSHKKITFANFEGDINHDNLTGFVANEHIDWTAAASAFSTTSTGAFGGDVTIYEATNDGNPEIRLGAADAEELHIQTVYDSLAQTLDYALFQTDAASATANKGLFRFNVDGTDILDIDDGGIDLDAGMALSISGTDVLNATTLGSGVTASSLTSVGTISTGTWEGTTIAVNQGGTGQTSYTNGQLLIGNTTGNTLAKGTITGGTNLTVTNGTGSITLDVDDAFLLNSGDVGTGVYDFGGATSFEIPNSATPTVNAAGEIAVDTTITDHTGLITYYDGVEALYAIALPTANLTAVDGHVISYNATNNEFEMAAAAASDTFATIQVDGVAQSTNAPTLDFDGTDFTLTESPTDDFDITINDSGIDHDALTNFVANEHIDWTAASSAFSTTSTGAFGGNVTIYEAVNDGNPEIRLGAADAEELHIQTVYDSVAQTLDYALFQTDAASATANKGLFRFNVDGTDILDIDDGGIDLDAGMALSISGTDVLNATTLGSGVTASSLTSVGTITSGTWQGTTIAVDQGGTGATSLSDGYVLLGSGTGAITALDVTAKGSILVGDGTTDPVALAVGSNDFVLTADSAEASGLKWAAAAGGGGSSTSTSVSQATHGLAVGDVIRLSGASTYTKAQANTAANAEVVGIVSAVADTNNFTVTTAGEITGLTGLTANTVYFLSDITAGALTATEPADAGEISKPIFISYSTTAGYFYNMRGSEVADSLAAATQAEQEAGSSTTAYTTPGRQHYHPSAAKAWIQMDGTGTAAITTSYNITSITDNGTGDYDITIATDFSGADYCAVGMSRNTTGKISVLSMALSGTMTAGVLQVIAGDHAGAIVDNPDVCVAFFGDQ